MELELVDLAISAVESAIAAANKAYAIAQQNSALSADEAQAFQDRMNAAFASPAWQTDSK